MNIKNKSHQIILLMSGLATVVIITTSVFSNQVFPLKKINYEHIRKFEIRTSQSQSAWHHVHHGGQRVLDLFRAGRNLFEQRAAFTISVWGTGILFPISIVLAKLMGINIFFKNELSALGIWANVFQLFFFPVFFISANANIHYPPIFMGVLAGSHFVFYHWLYKCKTYLVLAFAISISSYMLGYLFLDKSYSVVGLSNAGWLLLGCVGLAIENKKNN